MESRTTGALLRIWSLLVVLFLYVPLAVIVLYAFNRSNVQTWPIKHFSTRWFSVAWNDQEVRDAFTLSFKVACAATAVALVLGTAAAFAVALGGEQLTIRMLLGGAMVLAAMYTVELIGRKADVSAEQDPPAELLHHEV